MGHVVSSGEGLYMELRAMIYQ